MFVIERLRVLDCESWKAAFDDHVEARIRHGAIGHRIVLAVRYGLALEPMKAFLRLNADLD